MKSFFAPATKAAPKKLAAQIEILSAHPVVSVDHAGNFIFYLPFVIL